MSKTISGLAVVLLFAAGFFTGHIVTKTAGPDEDYWVKRADYDAAVAERDLKLEAALEDVAAKDQVIVSTQQEAQAAKAEQERLEGVLQAQRLEDRQLEAENERLRTEVQPLIDANPKLRELIRSFDLRLFNKDAQIKTLTQERDQARIESAANYTSYVAAAGQAATWKKQYDDEHALRLSGDALRLGLEDKYKTSRFWASLGKWGPPAAFGLGLILGK